MSQLGITMRGPARRYPPWDTRYEQVDPNTWCDYVRGLAKIYFPDEAPADQTNG
jgi:hypothetical protein